MPEENAGDVNLEGTDAQRDADLEDTVYVGCGDFSLSPEHSFSSPLMLGTSSAGTTLRAGNPHSHRHPRLAAESPGGCLQEAEPAPLSQFPIFPEAPAGPGSCCPAKGQGKRGPQLLPKQPQAPSFYRQEGCPDVIFPLDGKH